MTSHDASTELQAKVLHAMETQQPITIVGGNSKHFLGHATPGPRLELANHRGILAYEPEELVLTARAGTPLSEIERLLAQHQQMIPFEPPHFGDQATLGGTIACALSGPRRPYAGAARDFVLGCKIINGKGEIVTFGGQVMKNVAGYDVSRLMTGAHGTLGVLLELSIKVLPRPAVSITLVQERHEAEAIGLMNHWAGKSHPIDGSCFDGNNLHLRLSGSEQAVATAQQRIGGDTLAGQQHYWQQLREHQQPFFQHQKPLWRMSLPATTPPLSLPGVSIIEWGGAQRWLFSDAGPERIRAYCTRAGGHALQFRGGAAETGVFHPLSAGVLTLHKRIKQAFDPHHIFNRGRMYAEL